MFNEKWDKRFLDMAALVASWSKDPSTKVGAVIVDSSKRVVGIGFNGFARGIEDSDALLHNRAAKIDRIIHAEINAVLNSSMRTDNYTLYVTIPPCNVCTNFIIQSGIRRVIWRKPSEELIQRWGNSWILTRQLLNEAGIESLEYDS